MAFGHPEFEALLELRDIVLRRPLNMIFTAEQIAAESPCSHFGCTLEGFPDLAGTLLMKQVADRRLKMRQVAVHPDLQGEGIGSYMVTMVEYWSVQRGYTDIELAARDVAVAFYKRLGYSTVGDEFTEVGIPHFQMVKHL